ncbi:hypothetical protein SCALM49S_03942 [Streptomyces californicus]
MAVWHVRDFVSEDLEGSCASTGRAVPVGSPPSSGSPKWSPRSRRNPGVVAVADGHLVGAAAGRVDGDRAWVRVALHPALANLGLGTALLSALEQRMRAAGAVLVAAALPEDETGGRRAGTPGFRGRRGLTYYEQSSCYGRGVRRTRLARRDRAAGRARERLAGMAEAKQLVERRLVLPLANPEAADEHGVDELPQAVVLFGRRVPATVLRPGRRLPARLALRGALPLADRPGGRARQRLGRRFEEIAQLDDVLVFIDEVEEVAGTRNLANPVSVGVVNELLKSIVRFRDRDGRLLVCATNTVAALDPAFLRHGRFDYACSSARPTTRPAPRSGPATSPVPAPRPTPPSWPTPARGSPPPTSSRPPGPSPRPSSSSAPSTPEPARTPPPRTSCAPSAAPVPPSPPRWRWSSPITPSWYGRT